MGEGPEFLTALRNRLTNLSASNRMVFLPALSPRRAIDLTRFSQLDGMSAYRLLVRMLKRSSVRLCSLADPRLAINNQAADDVLKLYRTTEAIREETGASELHLGWPLVEGQLNNGTPVRCPLLLVPVRLERNEQGWHAVPCPESSIEWNRTFLQALALHNDMPLAEDVLATDPDDWGYQGQDEFDELDFLNTFYQTVRDAGLPIDFNTESYSGQLRPMQDSPKKEFLKTSNKGRLRIMPTSVLGLFPLSDSFLDPDYRDLIRQAQNGRPDLQSTDAFFQALSKAADDESTDRTVAESRITCVFPSDPWQESVVRAVRQGKSVVVEGPPGTGKSQLIGNLVADAIAAGKRVLVVSQKRTALEVIRRRMEAAGLDGFMVHVHDIHSDRRYVYDHLASQINRFDHYHSELLKSDTILAERRFLQVSNRIDQITDSLKQFRAALEDTSVCGVSIRHLYLRADRQAPVVALRPYLNELTWERGAEVAACIRALARHREVLHADEGYVWWENRIPFCGYGQEQLRTMQDILRVFRPRLQSLSDQVFNASGLKVDLFQFRLLMDNLEQLAYIRENLTATQMPYLNLLSSGIKPDQEVPTDLWLANLQRLAEACFADEGLETSLPFEQLGALQQAVHRARSARRNIFRWIHWTIFSADQYLVKRALVANGLSGKKALERLERRLDNRLNLEHLFSKLRETDWCHPLPVALHASNITEWFTCTRGAVASWNRIRKVRGLETYLSPSDNTHPEILRLLRVIEDSAQAFRAQYLGWLQWFTPVQLEGLDDDPLRSALMMHFLDRHFDRMCAEDDLLAGTSEMERDIRSKIMEAVPDASPDHQVEVFMNSLRMAWIDHLENRIPELRIVSSGVMEELESELGNLIAEKRELARRIGQFKAMERVVDQTEINRLKNRVTYRELFHQATKKRKVWPLRKTIQHHTSEIFRLLPCWLASPESVSALFPPDRMFDLVLFDEASQCFAERGLPALARANQAVVAGDPMQLRPSDLYRMRWTEDSDQEPDLEAESLLDLARMQFQTIRLRGHYRSRSPELIAFSNRHFYKGELRVIPDAETLQSGEKPIQLEWVEGIWEHQVNLAEAERVVELVLEHVTRYPDRDLGVVTFNRPQQELVLDLLEKAFLVHGIAMPESLLVKNIENVQGDERDVIIFSIGYAPGPDGKFRMNFGSLSAAGGSNRLNVAITRARRQIRIVTGLHPSKIQMRESMNEGARLLREWLEFVMQNANGEPDGQVWNAGLQEQLSGPFNSIRNVVLHGLRQQRQSMGWDLIPFDGPLLLFRTGDGQYRAILTDDEDYISLNDPKYYHDGLRRILEQLSWGWTMLYARNYWYDRERFAELGLQLRN